MMARNYDTMMYVNGRRSIFHTAEKDLADAHRRRRELKFDLAFALTQTQEELWSVIPANSIDHEVFLHPFTFVPRGHHERFREQPSFAIHQHRVVCEKAFHHRKLETQPTD